VRSTQFTPGGIRLCGTREASPEVLAAVDELAAAVIRAEEARRAALSAEERSAEDARRKAAADRIAERTARLRGLR